MDLAEKRIDWISYGKNRQDSDKGATAEKEREREKNANVLKTINSYFINVVMLDPWHYVINWRSLNEFSGLSFFLNFQIISETEHECFGVYYEGICFSEKQRIDEKNIFYQTLQKIFRGFYMQQQGMNGVTNGDSQNSSGWKIKVYSKAHLVKIVAQLTLFCDHLDKYTRSKL